jgi:hypothetical protein
MPCYLVGVLKESMSILPQRYRVPMVEIWVIVDFSLRTIGGASAKAASTT